MSVDYQVVITETARREAEAIYDWIAADNRAAATKWLKELLESVKTLNILPERCPLFTRTPFKHQSLRQLLYGEKRRTYRILFEIRGQTVYIKRVIHSAREHL